MTNLQAAVGLAQLEQLDRFIERKVAMGRLYSRLLSGIPGIQLPVEKTAYADNVYWVFGLVLKEQVSFDAQIAMQRLAAIGVGTRPFFWPMHEQPVFKKMGFFLKVNCPVAENLARRGFYIPSGLALTERQIETVSHAIREIML